MATQRTARGEWQGDYRCEVVTGHFTLMVDEPSSVGGSDLGPAPTDLFLASVASCFALALSHSAKKRAVDIDGLRVDATGVYDGPRFSAVHVHADVGCAESELDGLLRSAERVCYVTNTLRGGPTLNITGRAAAAGSTT